MYYLWNENEIPLINKEKSRVPAEHYAVHKKKAQKRRLWYAPEADTV
ncbi:MAG: hypothetical protein L6V93_07665 [Clostridiales bacterium]|nr:MAG: hypothetical protein L6V93_07665 [Clostridiales bacterium]